METFIVKSYMFLEEIEASEATPKSGLGSNLSLSLNEKGYVSESLYNTWAL